MDPRWSMGLTALGCGICCALQAPVPALGLLAVLTVLAFRAVGQSERDELTGLGNRLAFRRQRNRFRHRGQIALVYFDLDHLKTVNDTLGHDRGDALLSAMAQALREAAPRQAALFRMGGDEFLAVLPPHSLESFLPRWTALCRENDLAVSQGYALGSGAEFDRLLLQAEQAMYQSRQ